MFFCEPCRDERDWPTSIAKSFGRCEICEKTAECYDVPSKHLPPPKAKTEGPTKLDLTPLTDDEMREFVLGVCDGRIFTDRHAENPEDLKLVFMVIGLGGLSNLEEGELEKVGCFYEYIEKAGPRSINGLPSFFSVNMLGKADTERAFRAIEAELERRKNIDV